MLHRMTAFCFMPLRSPFFEIALVLVRFDHVAAMLAEETAEKLSDYRKIASAVTANFCLRSPAHVNVFFTLRRSNLTNVAAKMGFNF